MKGMILKSKLAFFALFFLSTAQTCDAGSALTDSGSSRVLNLAGNLVNNGTMTLDGNNSALGVNSPGIERQVVVTIEKYRDTAILIAPFDC